MLLVSGDRGILPPKCLNVSPERAKRTCKYIHHAEDFVARLQKHQSGQTPVSPHCLTGLPISHPEERDAAQPSEGEAVEGQVATHCSPLLQNSQDEQTGAGDGGMLKLDKL